MCPLEVSDHEGACNHPCRMLLYGLIWFGHCVLVFFLFYLHTLIIYGKGLLKKVQEYT